MILALLTLLFSYQHCEATGFLRLESSGFLRESTERSTSTSTISLGPQLKGKSDQVEAELDAQALFQTPGKSTFTAEAKNAFVATAPGLIDHTQISVGRRAFDWSEADNTWNMGLYSPRFLWDPTRPQRIGLTGAFYDYHQDRFTFQAYGSFLSIPERGFPIRQQEGQIQSDNPFYTPLYSRVVVLDTDVPVQYQIAYPPLQDLLIQPNGLIKARYQETAKQGFWIQGLYGILPIYQTNISVESVLLPQQGVAEVTIHPRVLLRQLVTGEMGYKTNYLDVWASGTREIPIEQASEESWSTPNWQPSTIFSAGATVRVIPKKFQLRPTVLVVQEQVPLQGSQSTGNSDFDIALPERFDYTNAYRLGADYFYGDRIKSTFQYTGDANQVGSIYSMDLFYVAKIDRNSRVVINVGADIFDVTTDEGFIGQFRGNDRFRGGVTYAF